MLPWQRKTLWESARHGPALPAVAIGATVASAALTGVGMVQQANQTAAQARYQSAVAKNNAAIAEMYAKDAEARGRVEELNVRNATKRLKGRQRAVMAANGVLLDGGTPADILADTAALGEVDALTVRNNAAREALGYRTQGMNFQAEARLQRLRASNASGTIPFAVGGAVLDGISSVASKWYSFKNTGVIN